MAFLTIDCIGFAVLDNCEVDSDVMGLITFFREVIASFVTPLYNFVNLELLKNYINSV